MQQPDTPRCGMTEREIAEVLRRRGITGRDRVRSYLNGWRQVKCTAKKPKAA